MGLGKKRNGTRDWSSRSRGLRDLRGPLAPEDCRSKVAPRMPSFKHVANSPVRYRPPPRIRIRFAGLCSESRIPSSKPGRELRSEIASGLRAIDAVVRGGKRAFRKRC